MNIKSILALIFIAIAFINGKGQALSCEDIKQSAREALINSITQYRKFLSIPNIGSNPEHIINNLSWCEKTFSDLGFFTEVLISDSVPHLLATLRIDDDLKTVLFYLQIDGQPVDGSEWDQDNPFDPVLKKYVNNGWETVEWSELDKRYDPDWRIFARSSSDSKGPAMSFITALQILMKKNILPPFNIKVIMDFQEELGSPTLPALVLKEKEKFDAEYLLVMDGTRHLSNLPTLTFGARGIATVQLIAYGAERDLHSGQYGNFAPNPVFNLCRLIGNMKDPVGRVLIPGFYDGVVLSDQDKIDLNSLPEDADSIRKSLGIATVDSVGNSYQEALQYPSLNVRGLKAGWTGNDVRTILPKEAIAEIDMRLVPETPGERQVSLLRSFIEDQGFFVTDSIPTMEERLLHNQIIQFKYRMGSKAFRTDINSPMGAWLGDSMKYLYGDGFVKMRTTGGSQPMSPFITTLDIPAVSVRIPNPDNSIHAPNENLRLGNYLEGIEMCLSILLHAPGH